MESLAVNAIIGFWLILFGAMAVFPFVLDSKPARTTPLEVEEDRIISIQPVAMPQSPRAPLAPLTIPSPELDQREAA